ncbi:unannotated protein [freshwater metagenome]|uniref:Unannotated protein n=1 Tax=freshwater metagenome TaxID=449393 RepID=A0A6J5ZLS4_9ZZZZ
MPAIKLGNTRVTGKEQFYTPLQSADWVVAQVLTHFPHTRAATWLEPSAGTGAFIKALQRQNIVDVIAMDIEPHFAKVKRQDFLTWQPNVSGLVAIGNPPFGRNNSLSIPFFNKAAQVCDTIAFIVPRSWRKWSVTNRLDLNFHLAHDIDLDINYVDVNGADVYAKNNLQTCLQVWQRQNDVRQKVVIAETDLLSKCSPQEADIAIRVFGYGCGEVMTNFDRKSNTTMMFLKLHSDKVLPALQRLDFSIYFNNVAYTQALAYSEIRYALAKELA